MIANDSTVSGDLFFNNAVEIVLGCFRCKKSVWIALNVFQSLQKLEANQA